MRYRNKCLAETHIYSHPQTDCFVLSELFSVARHAGRSKPGSKPVQLYVRLCFRPLDYQAILRYFIFRNSSSSLCLNFLYPIGYQSAQFFRRALHYASGGHIYIYIYIIHFHQIFIYNINTVQNI